MATQKIKPSAYHIRKEMARIEGEIRLWSAIDPMRYADKLDELKARLKELA